jgi:hypothetical protein
MSDTSKKLIGTFRGVVAKNNDPNKQGRIQILLPHQTEPTEWAWPMVPAGQGVHVPDVGQGVWVKFEKGDPEFPLWFGEFGKNKVKGKRILIKPLLDSVSLTPISAYVLTVTKQDGTKEVDLTASLIAMANKLKDHETRITTLEGKVTTLQGKVTTLEAQMLTKASTTHTHP